MAVIPIIRYMILCDDWEILPETPHRIDIFGLLSNINSLEQSGFPLVYPELCVLLVLTKARQSGTAQIVCVYEETGQRVFGTPQHTISFGNDPLDAIGVPFRIRNCLFPQEGHYLLQFWYNGHMVDERPLRLR